MRLLKCDGGRVYILQRLCLSECDGGLSVILEACGLIVEFCAEFSTFVYNE